MNGINKQYSAEPVDLCAGVPELMYDFGPCSAKTEIPVNMYRRRLGLLAVGFCLAGLLSGCGGS